MNYKKTKWEKKLIEYDAKRNLRANKDNSGKHSASDADRTDGGRADRSGDNL